MRNSSDVILAIRHYTYIDIKNIGLLVFVAVVLLVALSSQRRSERNGLRIVYHDGEKYAIRPRSDAQQTIRVLHDMRARASRLLAHMERTGPDDPRTLRLKKRLQRSVFAQRAHSHQPIGETVNKGRTMLFCTTDTLGDSAASTYVLLHELAHVVSVSIGHTQEFWDNMTYLVQKAVDAGIYTRQHGTSRVYCNEWVTLEQ